jgi:hypothetical protein
MTFCSQSIGGRVHSKEPKCRSICLRKVFPHEVRNVISFKKHENVGPDGKAEFPLPKEGQPINLPRLLGGASNIDSEGRPKPAPTKYWDEGWYLWTGQSRWTIFKEIDMMMKDLEEQKQAELKLERRKEVWHDYQEHLKRGLSGVAEQQSQFWGPIVPPRPYPDTRYVSDLLRFGLHFDGFRSFSSVSLLVPLPPDFPSIFEKIHKFLKPTHHLLNIMHESFTSGEQKQFALRVWEKANSGESFVFAQRVIAYSYEQWKRWLLEKGDKGDGTKDSTKR